VKYGRLPLHRPARQVAAMSLFDVSIVDEEALTEGIMFDGSSIAGWKAITSRT